MNIKIKKGFFILNAAIGLLLIASPLKKSHSFDVFSSAVDETLKVLIDHPSEPAIAGITDGASEKIAWDCYSMLENFEFGLSPQDFNTLLGSHKLNGMTKYQKGLQLLFVSYLFCQYLRLNEMIIGEKEPQVDMDEGAVMFAVRNNMLDFISPVSGVPSDRALSNIKYMLNDGGLIEASLALEELRAEENPAKSACEQVGLQDNQCLGYRHDLVGRISSFLLPFPFLGVRTDNFQRRALNALLNRKHEYLFEKVIKAFHNDESRVASDSAQYAGPPQEKAADLFKTVSNAAKKYLKESFMPNMYGIAKPGGVNPQDLENSDQYRWLRSLYDSRMNGQRT